ncbi:MAG: polymer-forming cytoskeletal protein, partial [Deltaproteobacteria bacterium]|nr:polymer-forming cytoskeletal protein [Deltaproteobacteria bacterium]
MFSKKSDSGSKPTSSAHDEQPRSYEPTISESGREVAVIGRSIIIKGEVSGQEDLIVEGTIEGRIQLDNQHVTIGPSGQVQAEVKARMVTIEGEVTGNIQAGERVIITQKGSLSGDIQADRLSVEDGAFLKGTVSLNPREKEKTLSLTRPVPPSPRLS